MAETKNIIQQWQFLGKPDPKMLKDEAFECCKEAGITSLQSYFLWSEIEKERGKIDFSSYDSLVEKLKKHNLKWVPFFILGPSYATPDWFKKSDQSVFAQCLEHKKESEIQSIWNPFLPKWVDRFLRILSEHYQDKSILESICLGVSGNWGESIYPVEGGFYKDFHSHQDWWCGDKYAIENFRKYIIKKYNSLGELNDAWKTNFSGFELINFPKLRYSYSFSREVYKFIPLLLKPVLKSVYIFLRNPSKRETADQTGQQHWLDFVDWYADSMTNWAGFWLETARKYFPDNEIYLVTGGNGNPMLGADFSAQVKVAAKYNGGIRITNQTNNYSRIFALARLISSASKFYGSYFTTEEGQVNSPESVTMRIFDAITSGAKGFYCKNIIGTGKDFCSKKFFPPGEPTEGAEILSKNLQHLMASEPAVVKMAVFFPKTSIALEPFILDSFYDQCSKIRDLLDFDLLDENMVRESALDNYRFLAITEGKPLFEEIAIKIEEWIKSGGILISNKMIIPFGADKKIICQELFSKQALVKKIGQGYALIYSGQRNNYLEFIKQAVQNQENIYPWEGILAIDGEKDGVYATQFSDKIIYYNPNYSKVRKKVELKNLPLKFIDIEGNSIVSIPL